MNPSSSHFLPVLDVASYPSGRVSSSRSAAWNTPATAPPRAGAEAGEKKHPEFSMETAMPDGEVGNSHDFHGIFMVFSWYWHGISYNEYMLLLNPMRGPARATPTRTLRQPMTTSWPRAFLPIGAAPSISGGVICGGLEHGLYMFIIVYIDYIDYNSLYIYIYHVALNLLVNHYISLCSA